nr:peptide chain release factor H [uncultured Moellerella sp.]
MILLQFSSAQGPEECCIAVKKALDYFLQLMEKQQISASLIETVPSKQGLKSALVSIEGDSAENIANQWCGTLQWQCVSPLRPKHKRKNWFFGIRRFEPLDEITDNEIVFESIKSQGPGGQHVNKTESAIRAKHLATGITVKVQSERSQHANKKLARQLIAWHLEEYQSKQQLALNSERHNSHHQLVRGESILTFSGMSFKPS